MGKRPYFKTYNIYFGVDVKIKNKVLGVIKFFNKLLEGAIDFLNFIKEGLMKIKKCVPWFWDIFIQLKYIKRSRLKVFIVVKTTSVR